MKPVRERSLKIKTPLLLFVLAMLGVMLLLGTTLFSIHKNQREMLELEQLRQRQYRLADELLQSSEELSRMARAYVNGGASVLRAITSRFLIFGQADRRGRKITMQPTGIVVPRERKSRQARKRSPITT